MKSSINCEGKFTLTHIRDGVAIDARTSTKLFGVAPVQHWLDRLLARIKRADGLVTTTGVGYLATDFTAGLASPRISAMNFHDSGTGTNAANISDTALQTPSGASRVSGTQSTPSANVYQTVAVLTYTSTLAITEWGLFSAASSGTLWDRRVFSAVNVVNGDSLQITYQLTISAGGS